MLQFEPFSSLTLGNTQLWHALSGGPSYGGSTIHVSIDGGNSYQAVGQVVGSNPQGSVMASGGSGNTRFIVVNIFGSGQTLPSVTSGTAQAGSNLAYVNGEIISFQNAALNPDGSYTLTGITGNLYDSSTGLPGAQDGFCYIGTTSQPAPGLFVWNYPLALRGKSLMIKYTAFNVFGKQEQALSDVNPTSYTLTGADVPYNPPSNPAGGGNSPSGRVGSWLAWSSNIPLTTIAPLDPDDFRQTTPASVLLVTPPPQFDQPFLVKGGYTARYYDQSISVTTSTWNMAHTKQAQFPVNITLPQASNGAGVNVPVSVKYAGGAFPVFVGQPGQVNGISGPFVLSAPPQTVRLEGNPAGNYDIMSLINNASIAGGDSFNEGVLLATDMSDPSKADMPTIGTTIASHVWTASGTVIVAAGSLTMSGGGAPSGNFQFYIRKNGTMFASYTFGPSSGGTPEPDSGPSVTESFTAGDTIDVYAFGNTAGITVPYATYPIGDVIYIWFTANLSP